MSLHPNSGDADYHQQDAKAAVRIGTHVEESPWCQCRPLRDGGYCWRCLRLRYPVGGMFPIKRGYR